MGIVTQAHVTHSSLLIFHPTLIDDCSVSATVLGIRDMELKDTQSWPSGNSQGGGGADRLGVRYLRILMM